MQKHLKGEKGIVELKGDYEDNVEFALVMEVCKGGELFDRIIARHHYTEARAAACRLSVLRMRDAQCHYFVMCRRDRGHHVSLPRRHRGASNTDDPPPPPRLSRVSVVTSSRRMQRCSRARCWVPLNACTHAALHIAI